MSAAGAGMAAVGGEEQAEADWMMGGGEDGDGGDAAAERLAERARLIKRASAGRHAAGAGRAGELALADTAPDATYAQQQPDAAGAVDRPNWTALFTAALAEAADFRSTDSALPALSALSAALSDLAASTSPALSAASGAPIDGGSATAAPTDSSALLRAVSPVLPSLYSALRVPASSARAVSVVRAAVDVIALLCSTFPSALLLARSDLDGADSTGAAASSDAPQSRHPCVWSALIDAVDERLSDAVSLSAAGLSCGALCQLLRCCASLLPSTLSVLSVYGDVVGCVQPALQRVTARIGQVLIDPSSPALLVQYAAGAARCVLLTHTPIDVVDGLDPLLPASLSLSSSAARSSAVVPSSSSLSSFPVLSSELSLYFPALSPFDLRLVPDSHPDLDARQLRRVALGLLAQLTDSLQHCTLVSPAVSVHAELILVIVRQRSVAYGALSLPALLRFAAQLLSLPASSVVSGALQTVRLGLFALFRLSSCSAYWPAMLSVLSQPAGSILAMEAQRINKQRSHASTQAGDLRSQQPVPLQQSLHQSTGSLVGQPATSSPVDGALPALREVVSLNAASLQPLLSSALSLPLPLVCDLILRSLQTVPLSVSAQQQQQQVLIQVQAATKQLNWKPAETAHAQADNKHPSVASNALSLPAEASPSLLTAPALITQPLSAYMQSSLSRLCFVRILSTDVDQAAGQRAMTALRAALLPSLTVAGQLGAVEHTVEVTDSQLLASWAAEQQQRQHVDQLLQHTHTDIHGQQQDDEAEEDAESAASTRSMLLSLRLSSSLQSSADYSALLSYVLSDVIERYELAVTFAYKLARLIPDAIHIKAAHADDSEADDHGDDDLHVAARTALAQQPPVDDTEQRLDERQGRQPLQPMDTELRTAALEDAAQQVAAQNESRLGKRQLQHEHSTAANKQQRTEVYDGEVAPTADMSAHDWNAGPQRQHQTAAQNNVSEPSALPIVSPPVEDDSGGVLRSARFLSVLSSHFRFEGGIDYQQLVDGIVTALDSALFSTATAPATAADSSPACATLLQLLLDLPMLPPAVWSRIDRYLAASSSSSVGLLALRALIDHRPPASARAMRLLLRYAAVGGTDQLRQRCVDVAVGCIASKTASTQLRAIVVQRALSLAAEVGDPAFLTELPTIAVNIVVPPPPLYEDIQLPPLNQSNQPNQPNQPAQDAGTAAAAGAAGGAASDSAAGDAAAAVGAGAAAARGAGSVDSSISSLLSAVVGGGGFASSDGSEEVDEARRRAIQQLIADGARRKREFDKLVLRRQLLVKERELRERQAEERQQARKQRTSSHLALLLAVLHSSPRIAFDAAGGDARQLFECLWQVYAATGAAEPARKAIHSALPAIVAAVGPHQPLLISLQSQPAACDPCVLHVLQLLCTAPPSSDDSHGVPASNLTTSSREHSLVQPNSSVAVVCWFLYHTRRGDARFIIPLLPMLRADQLRRCLHRVVALPTVHLRVALHRMLRPHATLNAKGNRLCQPHPQPLLPAELVVALHRIDQHRRQANNSSAAQQQPRTADNHTEAGAAPPVSLPLSSTLPATADLSICPASSASTNYPSDDGAWLRSLISAVQLCFASIDLFSASTLASVVSALRVDRPLSRLFLRTCIQCVQLQPSLTSFVLSVVHSLVRTERSMVAVSLLWEGVLKLASLSLPASLELLLDLPDEGVARLFGSLSAGQLLAAVQTADSAAADLAADKGAGRKAAKQIKQAPLQMCQLAVARIVMQQPQRARTVYTKLVMPSEQQQLHAHQPVNPSPLLPSAASAFAAAAAAAASLAAVDGSIQLPPLPQPPPHSQSAAAVARHFAPPSAFDRAAGWSSSHPPPNPQSHPPGGAGGGGPQPGLHYPQFPAPLPPPPSPFAAAAPPFPRPFGAQLPPHPLHPTHMPPAHPSHDQRHQRSIGLQRAPQPHRHQPLPPTGLPSPAPSASASPPTAPSAMQPASGGWKSLRISQSSGSGR